MKKENINDLISKVKANNKPKTIQKVIPAKKNNKVEETQFSFYIEISLLNRIKQIALEKNQSIKHTITQVLVSNFK